jgi:PAS domain S-box-containing protein
MENKFKGLLESAPDAIIIVNQEGEIAFVNSRAERLFGYLRSELLNQKVEMLLPERFRQKHGQHRAGFFVAPKDGLMGAGTGIEFYGLRKDGTEFPAEITLGHSRQRKAFSFQVRFAISRHASNLKRLYHRATNKSDSCWNLRSKPSTASTTRADASSATLPAFACWDTSARRTC